MSAAYELCIYFVVPLLYLVQMSSCCREFQLSVRSSSHCGDNESNLLTAILRKLLL